MSSTACNPRRAVRPGESVRLGAFVGAAIPISTPSRQTGAYGPPPFSFRWSFMPAA
jgi:hypothetical protein